MTRGTKIKHISQFLHYAYSSVTLTVRFSYQKGVLRMKELLSDITSVSAKGQIVIPKAIRDKLQISPGVKLMVLSDGTNILLKPIPEPDISEFDELMDAAASWASDVGMKEEDITSAIKSVRSKRKQFA